MTIFYDQSVNTESEVQNIKSFGAVSSASDPGSSVRAENDAAIARARLAGNRGINLETGLIGNSSLTAGRALIIKDNWWEGVLLTSK